MKKILVSACDVVFLMRIPLLVPVWTVLLLGWITGNPDAHMGFSASSTTTLWIALAGFSFIVAGIYVSNQIRDVDSDRINNKLFILPRNIISIPAAWGIALACSGAGMGISLMFLPPLFTALFAVSMILGVFYNLPPFSLKDRPIGGTVLNFLGHGVFTYLVGFYAARLGTGMHWYEGLIPSLSAGFANAAVYLASTVADVEGDAATGKHTWAVAFGARSTAYAAAICCVASLAAAFAIPENAWLMIIPSFVSVPIFVAFALRGDRRFSFRTFRLPVAILSLSVALFLPLYAVMVLLTLVAARIYYKLRFNFDYPSLKAQ